MEPEESTIDRGRPTDDQATSPGDSRLDGMLDQLLAELSARWRAGDHRGIEDDLERHPSLAADPANAAALIYREFTLRREAGESVGLDDFQQRYPDYAEALARFAEAERLVGPPPPRLGPGARFGRYLIDAEPGRGGMVIVFKAYDPELDRVVALKLIRNGLTACDE